MTFNELKSIVNILYSIDRHLPARNLAFVAKKSKKGWSTEDPPS
jgi:hypothetical protein